MHSLLCKKNSRMISTKKGEYVYCSQHVQCVNDRPTRQTQGRGKRSAARGCNTEVVLRRQQAEKRAQNAGRTAGAQMRECLFFSFSSAFFSYTQFLGCKQAALPGHGRRSAAFPIQAGYVRDWTQSGIRSHSRGRGLCRGYRVLT